MKGHVKDSGSDGGEGADVTAVTPYRSRNIEAKEKQVERMFDNIAPAYDFMNTAMTFGLHRRWRDTALHALAKGMEVLGVAHPRILDVATGTGDVAFRLREMMPGCRVDAIDLSEGMLEVAREKMDRRGIKGIDFAAADCLDLPFPDGTFDAVTVAYGVRNFSDLPAGLGQIHRVLRRGGLLCIIELSEPEGMFMKAGYRLYARHIIPLAGRLISGDSSAYTYLPASIAACPQRDAMTRLMEKAGFRMAHWRSLTFGAVTLYFARK